MDYCRDDALKLDYLNGLLSEKDLIRFEEHLAVCPGCRREIDELRNTVAAVVGLTPPPVAPDWTAAAKDRFRAKGSSPARRRIHVFQYGLITAGVIAALVLLLWLVLGGTVWRWHPGLSTAALGISELRAARMIDRIALVLSLYSLLLVPSIIENVYQLVRRADRQLARLRHWREGGEKRVPGTSAPPR